MTLKNSDGRTVTLAEIRAEIGELTIEADELLARNGDNDLDTADAAEFTELTNRLRTLKSEERRIEDRAHRVFDDVESGRAAIEHGTPQAAASTTRTDRRGHSARDDAMRVLDSVTRSGELPDHGAEKVEHLLSAGSPASQSLAARWAIATGAPEYRSAFAKLCSDPDRGHLLWDAREGDAYRAVAQVQNELRGGMVEGTGSLGGAMVPLTLDPAIMLSSNGSANPLRQIARTVQVTTAQWSGVTSAGVTSEWTAETAEMADATPTLSQLNIPVFKGDAFVPFSFEVGNDAVNFLAELQKLLIDGADQLQATAFTTGSGIGAPRGLVTALAANAGSVVTATGEAITAADVFALQNALPPRFQPNAQWTANLSIVNALRQLETPNGALRFPELNNVPPYLLGRRMNELSNMDGVINPAATESNYVAVYGDFSQFVIVDRIGTTLELVPHLVGANRRPTGQRGALLWFRTGSDVVVPNAFRLLNVATTA